ncbi:MAG TPA: hypothetical protein VHA78_03015 [Candidatus Peribacteraceae bacterium]|nr:hypothetical protein [Candidatus Peribacteraceae bacterium]
MSFDEVVEMLLGRMKRNGLDFDEKHVRNIPDLPDDFSCTIDVCSNEPFFRGWKKHYCEHGDVHIPVALIVPSHVIEYRDASVVNPEPLRQRGTATNQCYWLPNVAILHNVPDYRSEYSELTFNECACVFSQNPGIGSIRVMSEARHPAQIYSNPRDARHIVADAHIDKSRHCGYLLSKRTEVPRPYIDNLEPC